MTLTQDQHNNVTLTKTERMYDLSVSVSVSVEWKVVCCICRSVHLKKSSRSEKRKTKNGVKCMFSRPADVQIILRVLRREFAESLDD